MCIDLTRVLWSPAHPGHAAWALAPPLGGALMALAEDWSVLARARSSIASCGRSVETMLGPTSAVAYSLRVASRDEHRAMLRVPLRTPLDGHRVPARQAADRHLNLQRCQPRAAHRPPAWVQWIWNLGPAMRAALCVFLLRCYTCEKCRDGADRS